MAPGLQNYSILEARKSSSEWNVFSYALAQKQGVVLNGSGKSDVHLRSWNFRSTIFKSRELRDRKGFLTRRRHEDRQKNIHSASLLSFSDQRCNRALYQKSGILEKGQ